jgi:amidophosphoribosyltransferase
LQDLFAEERGHGGSCFACFTGKYPTGEVTHYLRHIQEERQSHRPAKAASVSAKAPAPTEH